MYLIKESLDNTYCVSDTGGSTSAANAVARPVARAALTVLEQLYTQPDLKIATRTLSELNQLPRDRTRAFSGLDTLGSSYQSSLAVCKAILNLLATKSDE